MNKILFITSSRIGDAVLSSGLLSHIEQNYPSAKVTIACAPLVTSLFEGYPLLERIIPLQKQSYNRHWIKLWREVVTAHWDIVIDLRDSAVSRLIRADKRYIFSKQIDKSKHKIEQNAQLMGLSPAPASKLWFSEQQKATAKTLLPKEDGETVIGIGPTANWIGKTWPVERFIEIAQWLMDEEQEASLPERQNGKVKVAIFGAPGEEDIAYELYNAMPENRRLDIIAKGNPGTAAATLARCDLYIGNDSGLMHCAAAAGVKTIGLFGPSYPHIYAPWGPHTTYAQTPESFDELINFEGYHPDTTGCLMDTLTVDMVKKTITDFLKKLDKIG